MVHLALDNATFQPAKNFTWFTDFHFLTQLPNTQFFYCSSRLL